MYHADASGVKRNASRLEGRRYTCTTLLVWCSVGCFLLVYVVWKRTQPMTHSVRCNAWRLQGDPPHSGGRICTVGGINYHPRCGVWNANNGWREQRACAACTIPSASGIARFSRTEPSAVSRQYVALKCPILVPLWRATCCIPLRVLHRLSRMGQRFWFCRGIEAPEETQLREAFSNRHSCQVLDIDPGRRSDAPAPLSTARTGVLLGLSAGWF